MNKVSTKKIVATALITALTTVATMVVQIPIPAVNGYVNLGDVFVIFGALALGAVYGGISAGIGSALADLILGYAIYAPATFIIKTLMAVVTALIYKGLKKVIKPALPCAIIGGLVAEILMVLGYFFFEAVVLSYGLAASASMLFNLVQGGIGLALGVSIYMILYATGVMNKFEFFCSTKSKEKGVKEQNNSQS